MKNTKIILLVLIGVLLICSFGCGGGGGGLDDEGNAEPQEEEQEEQIDETVSRLTEKILSPSADGSPMIFDYAPVPDFPDEDAPADPQGVHFVKYISSKDLNSNGEYVKTIHLNKDSEYVIKYSHGGRTLNNSLLGVRVTAPDKREMILDLYSFGSPDVSADMIPVSTDLTEAEVRALLTESGDLAEEEIEAEVALYIASLSEESTELLEPYYVPVGLDILPEENPCIIMYIFKAPLTGDYEFAVSELVLESADISVDRYPDVPFEFRIYNTAKAHSVSDGEEIELSPRDILAIQRILLDAAAEFNENGLPIGFISDESDVEASDAVLINGRWVMLTRRQIRAARMKQERRKEQVIVDAVINDVPYDDVFVQGAGFYAHSGLPAAAKVVKNFKLPTPATGNAIPLKENFDVTVIATQEEHDRAQEIQAMSNFVLLRNALGHTTRQDYARLGSDHTKVISVRYELIEEISRTVSQYAVKIDDEILEDLKKEGHKSFLNDFGDYFVSGYTWGSRYEAIVEIAVEPGKSYYRKEKKNANSLLFWFWEDKYTYNYDAATVCNEASQCVQDLLKSVKENAISERNKGKPNDKAKENIEKLSKKLQEDFYGVTIDISHCTQTGRAGEQSFSLDDFTVNLANFIKSAKKTPRAQYGKIYVTLTRFREIQALKSYIPVDLEIKKSLYENIRTLTETVYRTRCYYNALMAIPASNLRNGTSTQDKWKQEFETELTMRMEGSLNRICADEKSVAEYQAKFSALLDKYKALAERYNFYRYFVIVQRDTSSASWTDSDSDKDQSWGGGFQTYSKSELVQADIKAGDYHRYHHAEPCTSGPRGATFSGELGNEYIIWYKTGYKDTNHCTGKDANGKTIGKNHFNWVYTGASSRVLMKVFVFQNLKP